MKVFETKVPVENNMPYHNGAVSEKVKSILIKLLSIKAPSLAKITTAPTSNTALASLPTEKHDAIVAATRNYIYSGLYCLAVRILLFMSLPFLVAFSAIKASGLRSNDAIALRWLCMSAAAMIAGVALAITAAATFLKYAPCGRKSTTPVNSCNRHIENV